MTLPQTVSLLIGILSAFLFLFILNITRINKRSKSLRTLSLVFLTISFISLLLHFLSKSNPVLPPTKTNSYKATIELRLDDTVTNIVKRLEELGGQENLTNNSEESSRRKSYLSVSDFIIWNNRGEHAEIDLTLNYKGRKARTYKAKKVLLIPELNRLRSLDIQYTEVSSVKMIESQYLDSCRILKTLALSKTCPSFKEIELKLPILLASDYKGYTARLCPLEETFDNFTARICINPHYFPEETKISTVLSVYSELHTLSPE